MIPFQQRYAGCERRFPKIIGGSDLVVHQALSHVEHEDWFLEAREVRRRAVFDVKTTAFPFHTLTKTALVVTNPFSS